MEPRMGVALPHMVLCITYRRMQYYNTCVGISLIYYLLLSAIFTE
jgi:hypothetical protein